MNHPPTTMRIVVTSRSGASKFRPEPGETYAVLSFVDAGANPHYLHPHPGFVSRHVCVADDIEPGDDRDPDGFQRWIPMTEEQAAKVAAFVNSVAPTIDVLLIHCVAGVSRSAAAGMAIAWFYRIPQVTYTEKGVHPSRYIRTLLARAFRPTKELS